MSEAQPAKITSRTVDLAWALSSYPFEGDETDTLSLSDKIVVGRKPYDCQVCLGPVLAGERHRALTEINREDRKVMTFRFCGKCTRAQAMTDAGDWEQRLLGSRYRLGERRAQANRKVDA